MARVLLARESWISVATDVKGCDSFSHSQLEVGARPLIETLHEEGHTVPHMPSHVPADVVGRKF
jgi:uncharacterized membrane protein